MPPTASHSFSDDRLTWPDLPVVTERARITAAINERQVVVICGETGSGKTTQLPKICLAAGRGTRGQIGHTQPRRLAARTVAGRIAEELDTPLGEIVGYKVRFTDVTQRDTTRVKLMTDGILLAETRTDRDLRAYDTLILDEAHERSLNIDFLLGYIKRLLPRRPDLKLILTSATIDPERFSRHFDDAPIIMVGGRTYPVETRYFPLAIDEREVDDDEADLDAAARAVDASAGDRLTRAPESTARAVASGWSGASSLQDADLTEMEGVVAAARGLIAEGRGDILTFLPTERDIRETADALVDAGIDADILPLFGRLSAGDQLKVFRPDGKRRRIILATNVAETSVTVPGIHCVIDTGLARVSRYSPRTKVQRLPIEPVSRASADQRRGRCGRVAPGVCVRLYSEKDYDARPAYTEPEILRTNLASVILQMMWLKLGTIESFPFLDPPDAKQVRDGLATLHEIGAIDEEYNLTPIGTRLAKLPVDVRVGRMIVGGQDESCLDDVLVIAAALSSQDVRERPSDQRDAADQAHAQFRDDGSDFVTILKLWRTMRQKQTELGTSQFRKWCRANFVSYLRFREWTDVQAQLRDLGNTAGVTGTRARRASPDQRHGGRQHGDLSQAIRPIAAVDADDFPPQRRDAVHRALLGGLLGNVAFKNDTGQYVGARGTKLAIWPGSALTKSKPPWIMSAELIETTRLYSRTVAPVRPEWVDRAAKHLVKRTHTEPHWVKQTAHVHAFERVTLWGLILVARRSVHLGPIDPVQSRQLFIQHALVLGEFGTDHPSILANRRRLLEVESWQRKLRRQDLLSEQAARFAFFDGVIPPQVYSGPTFEQWAQRTHDSNSHLLDFPDDVMLRDGVLAELVAATPASPSSPTRDPQTTSMSQSSLGEKATQASQLHGSALAAIRDGIAADYPDTLVVAGVKLPLEYHFDPGEDRDGLTLVVPVTLLPQLRDERAEWLVPGLVPAKIDALIRSLPKRLRTLFVPVSESVAEVHKRLGTFGVGSFVEAVAGVLWKLRGEPVTRADFQAENIPPHLLLNVRVVDAAGATLAEGQDIAELRGKLNLQVAESFTSLADVKFTRDNLARWDFGDLPEKVEIEQHGIKLFGYPALVENGDGVALRLLDSQQNAARLMPAGLRRLFMVETARELKLTLRDLPNLESLRLNYRPFGTGEELMADLTLLTADRAFFAESADAMAIRTQPLFAARAGRAWGRLHETSRALGVSLTDILNRHRTLSTLLHRDFAPLLVDAADDMRQQLARLLPKRFLSVLPGSKLEQLPRYLRGIEIRLNKLTNAGLSRDLTGMATLRPWQQQYDMAVRAHQRKGVVDPALAEFRWLLEELRISLFAQDVKTIVPVSPKRLDEAWKAVRVV